MIWITEVRICRNRSWEAFRKALRTLLQGCVEEEGRYLLAGRRDKVRYIQIRAGRDGGLSCEAVSNDHLTGDERLSEATVRRLRKLGWKKHCNATHRNFSRHWAAPVAFDEVVEVAISTLAVAYQVDAPTLLELRQGCFRPDTKRATVTMVSENRGLQLPSGLVVRNAFTGRSYRVGAPLGAGGFGAVYRITQVGGPRIPAACALKVTLEPTAWHREAYFGDLLKNEPAVVRMFESFAWMAPEGQSHPLYCLVSELMDGGDVQNYMVRRPEQWKESRARFEVIRLLRAVRLLHQGGAVHRDLTPRNIFVTAEGGLKIGDFGIALHSVSHKGVAADVFNPGYAPPDLLASSARHWSPADDVFHIGKLYAMLLLGRTKSTPSPKDVKNLPCSAAAKAIIQRCIGEKRRRFRNADELLAALEKKVETPQTIRVQSLDGKHVVFTGKMGIQRSEARRLAKQAGAICQHTVNQNTDIVVVGEHGSPHWIAEEKGHKLLDVDREWANGHRIAVIGESRFLKLVGC